MQACKESSSTSSSTIGNILSASEISDPKFLKDYFLDGTMTEVRKKFQGNVQPYTCNKEDSKACKDKGAKCICYDVVLARTQFYAQDLYLTVINEKIVATFQATNAGTRFYSQLETVQSVFGDEAPSKIYEEKQGSYGYQTVALVWDIKDGHVFAMAQCPLSNSTGKKDTYKDGVRNCKVEKTSMNRLRAFKKADWMLESNLKY
jgi:hypothetical protein